MVKEIIAKSILRKHKKIDSWFLSSYSINLYRGCAHNCVYCDGRNEKYQVEEGFGENIIIKSNALELLDRELNTKKRRKPFANGFMVICGGVSDSYQPIEYEKQLTRKTLELLAKYNHPVHMLTKSTLIERDIDILQEINLQSKAVISFSFSSVDDKISKMLEPATPIPSRRLAAIKRFKDKGFCCGMFLMPVVPFITDAYEMIERAIFEAKKAEIDFVIFSGLTLKDGRQKDYFVSFLKKYFPEKTSDYGRIYSCGNEYGSPDYNYMATLNKIFDEVSTKYDVPKRMPAKIFQPFVSLSELVILILEQLDYLVRLKGDKSSYNYAAYSLSKINKPIEILSYDELIKINGIGPVTARMIREIVETKRCGYYERMLSNN